MDSFLLFTSLQAAWESFSIPEIVALSFLSWWHHRQVTFPLYIRTHSVFWASIQKAPDKISGGEMLALLESGHAGSSAAGQLPLGWDGLMGISLADSDRQLSHRAARFPWNLDLVGLNLAPRVLSLPELMSQNIICWCIDCVRTRWKASLCFFSGILLSHRQMPFRSTWTKLFGARNGVLGLSMMPCVCRWPHLVTSLRLTGGADGSHNCQRRWQSL